VEETSISISPSGVEHGAFRWRRATLPEAKMVIHSYHAQQNLPMSGTFTATTSAGTKRKVSGQAESVEAEFTDVGNGQDLSDVTLVPRDVTHARWREAVEAAAVENCGRPVCTSLAVVLWDTMRKAGAAS
jgi:hypothetical protein